MKSRWREFLSPNGWRDGLCSFLHNEAKPIEKVSLLLMAKVKELHRIFFTSAETALHPSLSTEP